MSIPGVGPSRTTLTVTVSRPFAVLTSRTRLGVAGVALFWKLARRRLRAATVSEDSGRAIAEVAGAFAAPAAGAAASSARLREAIRRSVSFDMLNVSHTANDLSVMVMSHRPRRLRH